MAKLLSLGKTFLFLGKPLHIAKFLYFMSKPLSFGETFVLNLYLLAKKIYLLGKLSPLKKKKNSKLNLYYWQNLSTSWLNLYPLTKPYYFFIKPLHLHKTSFLHG